MEQYTSENARRDFRRILNDVERGESVAVTRYGKPLAIVVNADWYESAISFIGEFRPNLGRFEVHHRDGDPRNNAPDNLELRERSRTGDES